MIFIERLSRILPDKIYIQLMFFKHFRKFVDFKKPKTYSEKLQWIKLYDHNPLYTVLVDKYRVKDYVAEKIGKEYIIPTLGVWDDPSKIDFRILPESFVLKWNHDSGSVIICKDKAHFDINAAITTLKKRKSHNGYWYGREWPYKDVTPMIIAEEYMEDAAIHELRDYKFFCFNGVVKALFVASDRQDKNTDTKFDFFDQDYNHLPIKNGHPNADIIPQKPMKFDDMKKLAEKLSEGFPEIRVDFYEANGHIYFGELTLFHWSGFMPYEPSEWDETFGSWIHLPTDEQ